MNHVNIDLGPSNKILMFTDLHAHEFKQFSEPEGDISSRLRWILQTLRRIFEYAANNNIQHVFFLGDLLHLRSMMKSIVFTKISEVLTEWGSTKNGLNLHFITGNHDLIYDSPNAPVVYSNTTGINHIKHPTVFEVSGTEQTICAIPFRYNENQVKQELAEFSPIVASGGPHLLLGHFEVSGAVVSDEYVLSKPFEIEWFADSNFEYIMSGHVHKRQQVTIKGNDGKNRYFFYIGSPLQHDFNHEDNPYGFCTYNFEEDKLEFVELKTILSVPEFKTINIHTKDDVKEFLQKYKHSLDFNYFRFKIHDSDLKLEQLFKKVKFFSCEHIYDLSEIERLEDNEDIRFDVDVRPMVGTFLKRLENTQDLSWVVPDILENYLQEVIGS